MSPRRVSNPARLRTPLTPPAYLRRLRRRRAAGVAALLLALATLIFADRSGWLLHDSGDWSRYEGRAARVVHVVDGDTIDVDLPDGTKPTTRIRLWGIDTPEMPRSREGKAGEPFAQEATDLARSLAEHRGITLRLQPHRARDLYDRLLAYVELPDGSLLNERLLEAGVARHDPRFEHRLFLRFQLIEKQAKFDKVGLWSR